MSFYEKERRKNIRECTKCGQCIEACQEIKRDEISTSFRELQYKTIEFLKKPFKDDDIYYKAFCCIGCYKCTDNICPNQMDAVVTNDIIRWEYIRNGFVDQVEYINPMEKNSQHRILASVQTNEEEYKRISTKRIEEDARVLFFPGCNIYQQPDKLLAALDIMDSIGKPYHFFPGLDYCCGNIFRKVGELEKMALAHEKMCCEIEALRPRMFVLWCPTCMCNFELIYKKLSKLNCHVMTFNQYISKYKDKLDFKEPIDQNITIHDPCKLVYTNIDALGPREVLEKIDGLTITEKFDSVSQNLCCGARTLYIENDCMRRHQEKSIEKALQSGADIHLNTCHTCHKTYLSKNDESKIITENSAIFIANALGFTRNDLYKALKQCQTMEHILKIIGQNINTSTFSIDEIEDALKSHFLSY